MSLLTQIFRSPRREGMYLYVDKAAGLRDVPEALLARFGEPEEVMTLLLDPDRPLLELYDLQSDPDEFNNLATSAAHREIFDDLVNRLSAWMHATYDFLPPGRSVAGEPPGRNWPVSL